MNERMDEFTLEVNSSNKLYHFNTSQEFRNTISEDLIKHPGEWEVCCLAAKTPVLSKSTPTPFFLWSPDPNNTYVHLYTGYYSSAQNAIIKDQDLWVMFGDVLDVPMYSLEDMAEKLNASLHKVEIEYQSTLHKIPFDFVIKDNQLAIEFKEFETNGVFQVRFSPALANMLQFTHYYLGFDGAVGTVFLLPGTNFPVDDNYWTNVASNVTYYTGRMGSNLPNTVPNKIYFNPAPSPSQVEIKLLNITFNMIEETQQSAQDYFKHNKSVFVTIPEAGKMCFIEQPLYHRLKKGDIQYMVFKITNENNEEVDFYYNQGSAYHEMTVLYLHFRRLGLKFQGQFPRDVTYKV